ncbi:tetratricopeptide repeat protein [Cognatilysobacter terrigena]|uniref:tetratricopeptide repeat protein n=1 Tax=Cognatilysobacter terrigena TaxID=2488749 RepID=UPI001414CE97|nr:tetratricopeptide repeat protein [Lysobacter terrigena]
MTADGVPPDAAVVASRYRFDDVVVDLAARTVMRAGEVRTVEPKAFAVLATLLERPGELVPRYELLDAVWGHRHVTPGVLTRVIAQLRHALDDDAQQPRYIQTRHALGYCFIGQLLPDVVDDAAPPVPTPAVVRDAPVAADVASPTREVALPPWYRRRGMRLLVGAVVALLAVVAIAFALRTRTSQAPLALEPSVAVRPFSMVGAAPGDRYFAEGLAAEMRNALASVHGLQVAPFDSAAAGDAREVGRRLGVAAVLDARVERTKTNVRVDAHLVDVSSGRTVWSRRFDRPLRDVFELQSQMAADVAGALVGPLPDAGEALRHQLAPTQNVGAFDAYLRGLHALLGRDRDTPRALEFFRQAIATDPAFARAQAAICRTEVWRYETQRNPAAFDAARLACRTAENMDPGIGEVQLSLGELYRVQGQADKAAEYYRRVIDFPGLRAQALVGLAKLDVLAHRPDDALARFHDALEADPSDAHIYAEMGYQQYVAGRVDAGVASVKRATELAPDDADHWRLYGGLLLTAGRSADAEHALERAVALDPDDQTISNLGTLKYQRGDYAAAAALYRRAIALSPQSYLYYANLGDALLADDLTAGQAPEAFRHAAELAQRYVDYNGGDALTLAGLGWYRANIGERERALAFVRRSEAKGGQDVDVALYNAETLMRLGDIDGARRRIELARKAGAAEERIATNPLFRRAGLVAAR